MLLLDANILIRAVLGARVLFILRKYAEPVQFLAPDTAFEEAREHLPEILERRQVPVAPAMITLDLVAGLVQAVEAETYQPFEDRVSGLPGATRTIGPSSPRRSRSTARFGPKTPTSSGAAWRLGLRTGLDCTWRMSRNAKVDRFSVRFAALDSGESDLPARRA
jgi:hypothetical protein